MERRSIELIKMLLGLPFRGGILLGLTWVSLVISEVITGINPILAVINTYTKTLVFCFGVYLIFYITAAIITHKHKPNGEMSVNKNKLEKLTLEFFDTTMHLKECRC